MAGRNRCSQACEECKRRKERCDGHLPCMLCSRRGRAEVCVFTTTVPGQIGPGRPHKRRRLTNETSALEEGIPPPVRPALHAAGASHYSFSGGSGTLAFLQAVGRAAESRVPHHAFVAGCRDTFMIEDFPSAGLVEGLTLSILSEQRHELAESFLTSTKGIFDLFDRDGLLHSLTGWSVPPTGEATVQDAVLLLVLAIGSQQKYGTSGEEVGECYFMEAQKAATRSMLEPPSIELIQAFLLLALYLFVVARRNAAFTHLGVAARAAECIGLHSEDIITTLSHKQQLIWSRAWKCLRILDLSSCSSLGRSLATRARSSLKSTLGGSPSSANALAAEIDSAAMQLCSIAESILIQVYEDETLTTQLAYSISQDLRDWTHRLPDILVPGQREALQDKDLPDAVCLNAFTGAYYWTTQLLTRPFLLADVNSRTSGRQEGQGNPATSHSPFADACVHSAFRCLDVTVKLTQYRSLPSKLFLVNNTTLVSALVLGLAFFGDYDQQFPLESGLNKALTFLLHMKADQQARHYAGIVSELISAAKCYAEHRDTDKLERRSAQIEAIFGSVHEKHEAGAGAGYCRNTPQGGSESAEIFANPCSFGYDFESPALMSPTAEGFMFQALEEFRAT